jgi:DNA replication protein
MPYRSQLIIDYLRAGTTDVPNLLLDNYKKIGINDSELLLIIQLLYFQNQNNYFPSTALLEERMSSSGDKIMDDLQRLLRQGFLLIDDGLDEKSGLIYEKYNLDPIFTKLFAYLEQQSDKNRIKIKQEDKNDAIINVFKSFEQEFGRPLSPIEIELITTWLDKDRHNPEIILYALKEAVFSNKLNFRYIDSILFEWQQKGIKSLDQVREHVKKFRKSRIVGGSDKVTLDGDFEPYNWLEESK